MFPPGADEGVRGLEEDGVGVGVGIVAFELVWMLGLSLVGWGGEWEGGERMDGGGDEGGRRKKWGKKRERRQAKETKIFCVLN